MLNDDGKLIGDFTVANAGRERFFVFGSGIAEQYHLRWFEAHLPATGVDDALAAHRHARASRIAGPKSRELLARVCRDDVSQRGVSVPGVPRDGSRDAAGARRPHLVHRRARLRDLGAGRLPARALRGDASRRARISGSRTSARARCNSLRLEKSFGTWAREYRPIYTPAEAGLDRFVDLDKRGLHRPRRGAARPREGPGAPPRHVRRRRRDADAIGDEPVWHDGKVVGWITSGGYGHCVGKSIALGYVPAALAAPRRGFEIEILGERRPAALALQPLHDPAGERMRRS